MPEQPHTVPPKEDRLAPKPKSKGVQLDRALLYELLKKAKPIVKHHYFFVMFLLLCGVVFAVYEVNQTLGAAEDDAYRQQKAAQSLHGGFDETTIDKIEALQRSNETGTAPPASKPGTRTNPFAE